MVDFETFDCVPSEMTTGCCKASFLFGKCPGRGGGTLLAAKCPASGTHHAPNARGLPGRKRGGCLWLELTSTSVTKQLML